MVTGHAIIELLLVIGLLVGLSLFMQQQVVTGTIGIVGGIMLVWMAWGIGRDAVMNRVTTMVFTAEGARNNDYTYRPDCYQSAGISDYITYVFRSIGTSGLLFHV